MTEQLTQQFEPPKLPPGKMLTPRCSCDPFTGSECHECYASRKKVTIGAEEYRSLQDTIERLQTELEKPTIEVECQSCEGKGVHPVYVGCDCTRSNPYDMRTCDKCRGSGHITATKFTKKKPRN